MRSVRMTTVGLVTLLLLGAVGAGTAAQSAAPSVLPSGPATTAAFTAAPCPVAPPLPDAVEGQRYVCGFVTVPQRHADPASPPLQLATMRILSTGEQREADPVVFAQGGPGAAGLDFAAAAPALTEAFADRDLILFDQRGAGHSVPFLHCDEHDPVALAVLTGQTPACRRARCGDRRIWRVCRAVRGSWLRRVRVRHSRESAADVRDVVTALGYTDYDFYGVSYGTRMARRSCARCPMGCAASPSIRWCPRRSIPRHTARLPCTRRSRACSMPAAAEDACSAAHPDLERTLFDTAASPDRDARTRPGRARRLDPAT